MYKNENITQIILFGFIQMNRIGLCHHIIMYLVVIIQQESFMLIKKDIYLVIIMFVTAV